MLKRWTTGLLVVTIGMVAFLLYPFFNYQVTGFQHHKRAASATNSIQRLVKKDEHHSGYTEDLIIVQRDKKKFFSLGDKIKQYRIAAYSCIADAVHSSLNTASRFCPDLHRYELFKQFRI